jgi:hypothetical protein
VQGTTFAEVLDQKLGELPRETVQISPVSIATPLFVPFTPVDVPFAFRRPAYDQRPTHRGPSAGELRAAQALESAAPQTIGFSLADLRSAFRRLAHAYHPDRHPGATGLEAAQLARTFAVVESNYRRLAVVASRD